MAGWDEFGLFHRCCSLESEKQGRLRSEGNVRVVVVVQSRIGHERTTGNRGYPTLLTYLPMYVRYPNPVLWLRLQEVIVSVWWRHAP